LTKIAIYGDSFAADYEGWPKYFGELMRCEVTTFGCPSTSVGFSYLKFLETHEQYDLIYFLWTSHNRNYLISNKKNKTILQHHLCFIPSTETMSSVGNSEQKINAAGIYFNDIKELNTDKLLLSWIKDENQYSEKYPNKNLLNIIAMRDSVKLKRPESVNIECFDFFKMDKNKITSKVIPGMYRIELRDMMQFSKTWIFANDKEHKKRFNHLTKIQNQEFAKYLLESFETKNFDIHKTFEKPEKYYTISKTLEESGFVL